MKRAFFHCGSHGKIYSPMVGGMIEKVRGRYESGEIDEANARSQISTIQTRLRTTLLAKGRAPRRVR